MRSPAELVVRAYAVIFCRRCGEARGLPTRSALSAAAVERLANGREVSCEACGASISSARPWQPPPAGPSDGWAEYNRKFNDLIYGRTAR